MAQRGREKVLVFLLIGEQVEGKEGLHLGQLDPAGVDRKSLFQELFTLLIGDDADIR
jgi:hypothetical protein